MVLVWCLIVSIYIKMSEWLLLTLLIVEIMTFIILIIISMCLASSLLTDSVIIIFFSVFVLEGVIGLSGLLLLVSFTGSDYVSSSSTLKC